MNLLWLAVLVLDIIAIVDLYKRPMDSTRKVLWIVAILLFPFVGMIVYFLVGKKAAPMAV